MVDVALIRSLWENNGCNFIHLPSNGASGGIIVMWKKGVVEMSDHLLGAFSVTIKFMNLADDFVGDFPSVYCSSDSGYYKKCWEVLNDIRILFDDPWVVGGNFNAIICQSEINRAGGCVTSRRYFKKFINKQSLIDLSMVGGKYTWTNSQQPPLIYFWSLMIGRSIVLLLCK